MMRRLLVGLVVLAAATAAVAAIAWLKGPAFLAPRLEAALSRATGHPATIRGGVRLGWANGPVAEVSGLELANAPWGSRPDMLVVPRVSATLALSDLLGGVVRIGTVRLERPDLLIETDAAGHGNWEPMAAPATGPPRPEAPASPAGGRAQIGTVTLAGGHVAFRDGASGKLYAADLDGSADVAADPVRVAVALRAGSATLHVDGTVGPRLPLVANLSMTGTVAAPERVDLAARLMTGQAGHAVAAEAHGAGVDASLSGVLDPIGWRSVGPVTLDATMADGSALLGRLGVAALGGPASLHGLLRQSGNAVSLRELRLALPMGDLTGELDLAPGTPPSLRGSLASRKIDLARLLTWLAAPVAKPPSPAAPAAAGSPAQPPATDGLPWQWLGRANLDVRLAAAEVSDGRVTIRDLSGHLMVLDGRLTLDPFGGTGPGGRVELVARADSRATPPTLAVALHAPALEVQPLVALAGLPGDVTGAAAIEADLHAAGATRPELLQTLTGRAAVSMGDGDLDLRLFGPVLAAARLPIDPHGRVHLRCLAAHAEIARGVAQLSPLVVDATSLLVQGTGSVDLPQQTLQLRLRPLLRTGPGIVVPVEVSGPWSRPKIELGRGDLAGVVASLVGPSGLGGTSGDACQAAGVVSAAPLPAPKKLKPADLLRSLLR